VEKRERKRERSAFIEEIPHAKKKKVFGKISFALFPFIYCQRVFSSRQTQIDAIYIERRCIFFFSCC